MSPKLNPFKSQNTADGSDPAAGGLQRSSTASTVSTTVSEAASRLRHFVARQVRSPESVAAAEQRPRQPGFLARRWFSALDAGTNRGAQRPTLPRDTTARRPQPPRPAQAPVTADRPGRQSGLAERLAAMKIEPPVTRPGPAREDDPGRRMPESPTTSAPRAPSDFGSLSGELIDETASNLKFRDLRSLIDTGNQAIGRAVSSRSRADTLPEVLEERLRAVDNLPSVADIRRTFGELVPAHLSGPARALARVLPSIDSRTLAGLSLTFLNALNRMPANQQLPASVVEDGLRRVYQFIDSSIAMARFTGSFPTALARAFVDAVDRTTDASSRLVDLRDEVEVSLRGEEATSGSSAGPSTGAKGKGKRLD